MSLERFFEWYPRYKSYMDNPATQKLYDFLSTPENIERMLVANDQYNKPALSGVIEDIERLFHSPPGFDLDNHTTRQLTGSMVREIISDFGYEGDKQKNLTGTSHIQSATIYKKTGAGKKELRKKVTVVELP